MSSPARERRVAQPVEHKTCRRPLSPGLSEGEPPGECRQDYRLERRETGGRAFDSRRASVAQGDVLPCLVAGPGKTGANAEGITAAIHDAIRREGNPDTPARLRDGSQSLFPLVAPALMEGSSAGRAAGCYPVGRGFEPLPSSQFPGPQGPDQTNPGECRAALQAVTLVVAGSSPAAPSTCGRVAQTDRARRVARPLSPGTRM